MFPDPKIPFLIIVLIVLGACKNSSTQEAQINEKGLNYYTEAHRPQYHFSPETAWMNDPNGLVYHQRGVPPILSVLSI